ncbi:hypothetical protein DFW101_1975 [Solidesulfovibrio carbinoliphilus subsp. oakridgensis]|uniref:Uncharacterized protein n=1 Tax=Solidesulfovibrio carbinoliphilus subsp. oakridgensis TaxID=694327 RepID=G7Q6P6_9BACT|nr:hypothetical protein [Solidesulfovibrio carbinoliphilus]EHJ47981.1 hypothetical protein DFW101_1975 [Solidesulfovibrio carbinoliphilus subsp. oakridgensis]
MHTTRPIPPAKPSVPHPVSLIYTIYRHGARLSEREALERAQATASRLGLSS